jgi:sulfatase modifying factor 1
MHKFKFFYFIIPAGILLLIIAACNLPGFRGVGTPRTPGEDSGHPTGPTNTDGAETMLIPAGSFWMGSTDTEPLANADEMPFHKITLDAFYFYTHEVTNKMYAACVEAGACLPINVMDSGPTTHTENPAYAEYPVVGVDWNMAEDYCTWAGGRLPTEAEWEYAARGAESLLYPWGAEVPACDRVNMLGCLVPPDTVKVGSYALGNSPFKVWDMAGNAWEWVHDWYDPDYYTLSASTSPLGPNLPDDPDNPLKVVRGGGLHSEPLALRSAERTGARPLRAFDDVGIRCVAEGALDHPAGYVPVPEGHEMVPPDPLDGGGELVEDPDDDTPWYSIGHSLVSCPDSEGRMHMFLAADTSEDVTYSVTVDGIPFDCYYDEMLRGLQCEGPVPAVTEYPDVFHVQIHFNPRGGIGHVYPDKPVDCDTAPTGPDRFSVDVSCPEEGFFNATFTYEPAITWFTAHIAGETNMSCVQVSETELQCTAPDLPSGDHYEFYLRGRDAAGVEREWTPWVPLPEGCPVGMNALHIVPLCFEGGPTVQVSYLPTTLNLVSASTVGVPLSCIGMAPGVQVCGALPGEPGSSITVTICFEGEECSDFPVTVPACPAEETEIGYTIDSACYPTLGPVAVIHYAPFDLPLVGANANGADLTCVSAPDGYYMCYTLPGTAGVEMTITFCLADGSCFSASVTVPACVEEVPSGDWRLIGVGCHDATQIYFMLDTGLDWLVPGADFTYTASDEETTYSCSVHPTVHGRVYCAGTRPESPGDLQFCLQRPGEAAPTCQTFSEYAGWVSETPACSIPAEPVEPVLTCPDYTNLADCVAHSCLWDVKGNICHVP